VVFLNISNLLVHINYNKKKIRLLLLSKVLDNGPSNNNKNQKKKKKKIIIINILLTIKIYIFRENTYIY